MEQTMEKTRILTVLEDSVRKWPDRPALWVKDQVFNYQDIWHKASQIALAIQANSRRKTSESYHIAIFAHKSASAYLGVWATFMCGKAYLPLNPPFSARRNENRIEQTQADIWIVDERCLEEAKQILEKTTRPILE
jgi:acyl-CoA synthetase (AMP-forming)/AMP-acid ligase II